MHNVLGLAFKLTNKIISLLLGNVLYLQMPQLADPVIYLGSMTEREAKYSVYVSLLLCLSVWYLNRL